jgi:hypothetical protein
LRLLEVMPWTATTHGAPSPPSASLNAAIVPPGTSASSLPMIALPRTM